jgi:hypothetical protein
VEAGMELKQAGLAFGGEVPADLQTATEEYNGTTWAASNPMYYSKSSCRRCRYIKQLD